MKPHIGYYMRDYTGGMIEAIVTVSGDQTPEQYRDSLDVAATLKLLRSTIAALESGDGIEAVRTCGAAWFRIASYHKG